MLLTYMAIFRNREDRIPYLIITGFFLIDVAAYFLIQNPVVLTVWALLALIPKGHICAWNHHHQHVATFVHAPMNRALELMLGLMTGITSNLWTLHHSIGHHVNYLDQKKDESRWMAADGKVMTEAWYTFEVGITAYGRAWEVSKRHPQHRRQFLLMGILTVTVAMALIAAKPFAGLVLFAFPMVFGLFFTAWATYSHHSGKSTANHMVASNNIIHKGYNILTGNLGYHTAHHFKPGVHWSKLPELHEEIADQIPADCYLTPGFPWTLGQTPQPEPETETSSPGMEPVAVPQKSAA
jgi:fatty acid desaturase